jgi:hypothetical protein
MSESLREQIIDNILKVAMAHHDDISQDDEYMASVSADSILALIGKCGGNNKPLSIWQIETVLRNNSIVVEGKKLVIEEHRFSDVCEEIKSLATPTFSGEKEKQYPCVDCGKLRTKDEGGTTFAVCDECWEKKYKPTEQKEIKVLCFSCEYQASCDPISKHTECSDYKPEPKPKERIEPLDLTNWEKGGRSWQLAKKQNEVINFINNRKGRGMEFVEFKKIPRLSREVVVTEKIDGTNGVIYIGEDGEFLIGSRTRWIDVHTDNHGFANWATEHKEELLKLGIGTHYGEWWGSGIQRGYNLPKGEKRFSLFNCGRWVKKTADSIPPLAEKQEYCPDCCDVVPILWTGIFDTLLIDGLLQTMKEQGSRVSPGFMNPEGIVIYHRAGNLMFKKTIEKDNEFKSAEKKR